MKWTKECKITLNLKGKIVEVVSITGLSRIVKKSPDTLRRYEREGIFPQAPIYIKGCRYYPVSFAESLAELVAEIPAGKKLDEELQNRILKLFAKEKERCQ